MEKFDEKGSWAHERQNTLKTVAVILILQKVFSLQDSLIMCVQKF